MPFPPVSSFPVFPPTPKPLFVVKLPNSKAHYLTLVCSIARPVMTLSRSRSALAAGLVATYWCRQVAAIQLWSTPGATPNSVPVPCRAALVQNITCANSLVTAPQVACGLTLLGANATAYCTSTCYDSLKTFQTKIVAGCDTATYMLFPNSTYMQSAAALADCLGWAYGVICTKDS